MSTLEITEEMQRESSERLERSIAGLSTSIDLVVAERNALRAMLKLIVHEYENTYDAECDAGGRWNAAAWIKPDLMERAKRLVSP